MHIQTCTLEFCYCIKWLRSNFSAAQVINAVISHKCELRVGAVWRVKQKQERWDFNSMRKVWLSCLCVIDFVKLFLKSNNKSENDSRDEKFENQLLCEILTGIFNKKNNTSYIIRHLHYCHVTNNSCKRPYLVQELFPVHLLCDSFFSGNITKETYRAML